MKHYLYLITLIWFKFSFCQVGVGTTAPNAALDVTSTTDGLLIPRIALTSTSVALPLTTPQKSELVYNTNTTGDVTPGFYYWETTPLVPSNRWIRLSNGSNAGNDWSTVGNAGTNASTNFAGTTDAVDYVVRTNNSERMRVFSNGKLAVNASTITQTDNIMEVTATVAGDDAITGFSVGAGGSGVQGFNTSTGTGVTGFNTGNGNGDGVAGIASGIGSGVYGVNNNPTANQAGFGIVGDINSSSTSTGAAIQAQANSPTATALVALNDLGISVYAQSIDPTAVGAVGAVYSTLDRTFTTTNQDISSVIGVTSSINVPSGGYFGPIALSANSSVSGVSGTVASRVTNANTDSFLFGVIGDVLRDSGVTSSVVPDRTGGVLGTNGSNTWGILGYRNSAGNTYGGYFSTGGTAVTSSGTGRIFTTPNNGIGIGVNGSFFGGYIKGNQYGLMSKGDEFGLYVKGNSIVTNPIIQLSEGNTKRVSSYATMSTSVDVSTRGKGKLINGKTFISFDTEFKEIASLSIDELNITVTPLGATKGVYVSGITKEGFYVQENMEGTSNAGFNWTAISTRKNYENGVQISNLILSNNYDENMNEIMFDESDTTREAKPIMHDGSQVKFERYDEPVQNMKSSTKMDKKNKVVRDPKIWD